MIVSPRKHFGFSRLGYRVGQGLAYLRPRRAAQLDSQLRALLRPHEFELLRRMPRADRAHHLDTYNRLVRHGNTDEVLLRAALLHDVGKVDGDVRVGLVQRTMAVILTAAAPRLLRRLESPVGSSWRRSLDLTQTHPERGAKLARDAGCDEQVCWLIAHHHDYGIDDERLELLRRADDGRLT